MKKAEKMKIPFLRFTLAGPIARFANLEANVVGLTYLLPPPRTLAGLLAGVMGEKDAPAFWKGILERHRVWVGAHPLAAHERLGLSVKLQNWKSANAEGVNLQSLILKGEGLRERWEAILRGSPTYRAYLLGPAENGKRKPVAYRIHLAVEGPEGRGILEELARALAEPRYPPYLGVAEALAWVEEVRQGQELKVEEVEEENLLKEAWGREPPLRLTGYLEGFPTPKGPPAAYETLPVSLDLPASSRIPVWVSRTGEAFPLGKGERYEAKEGRLLLLGEEAVALLPLRMEMDTPNEGGGGGEALEGASQDPPPKIPPGGSPMPQGEPPCQDPYTALARPGEGLYRHLREVGEEAGRLLHALEAVKGLEGIGEAGRIVGFGHDLGKLQEAIQKAFRSGEPPDRPLPPHARAGALLILHTLKGMGWFEDPKRRKWLLPIFLSVYGHHTGLHSLSDLREIRDGIQKLTELTKWAKEVAETATAPEYPGIHRDLFGSSPKPLFGLEREALKGTASLEKIQNGIRELLKELLANYDYEDRAPIREFVEEILGYPKDDLNRPPHFLNWASRILFSALVQADRSLSRGGSPGEDREARGAFWEALVQKIEERSKGLAEEACQKGLRQELIDFRASVFSSFTELAKKADLERLPSFFNIEAPTGSGKTLAALHAGALLAGRLEKEKGLRAKLIYVLPFIAILDQVEETVRGILAETPAGKEEAIQEALLVHHHLALGQLEEREWPDKLDRLIEDLESWDKRIILVTMEAFLRALYSTHPSWSRKLNQILSGSVVIMDEAHALDPALQPFLDATLRVLPGHALFLLMSATPTFSVKGHRVEAINLPPEIQPRRYVLAKEAKIPEILGQSSFLIVRNTVARARETYEELKGSQKGRNVYLLTSQIAPKHRREKLEKIRKDLQEGGNPILVSTQVVEAGVDLDFGEGARSVGTLEAVIQTAGRVNRNALKEERTVYILCGEKDWEDARKIYGESVMGEVERVLGESGSQELSEADLLRLFGQYRNKAYNWSGQEPLGGRASTQRGHDWRNKWEEGAFTDFRGVRFIEDQGQEIRVVVGGEEDLQAIKELISKIRTLQKEFDQDEDYERKWQAYKEIRANLSKLGEYMINVTVRGEEVEKLDLEPLDGKKRIWVPQKLMKLIEKEGEAKENPWEQLYNPETGWNPKGGKGKD